MYLYNKLFVIGISKPMYQKLYRGRGKAGCAGNLFGIVYRCGSNPMIKSESVLGK
jgi:hypothetical protein